MELKIEKSYDLNKGLLSVLISVLLGVVFDRLFFERNFGISYFIFISLCVSFFLWSVKDRLSFESKVGWFLLIPIAMLSFSSTVYTNEVFMALNILMVPFLMVVSSILISNPKAEWDKAYFIINILRKAIINVLRNLLEPFGIVEKFIKSKNKENINQERKQVIIGLLISLPILFIVIILLSSADMVFGYYISSVTNIFNNINLSVIISHLLIIGLVSFYLFGYVWAFSRGTSEKEESLKVSISWQSITVITVLVLLNIIYLMFTVIQFSYLYGGAGGTLPAGFTYAEYARRGFFELAAVTGLNFIIVLSCIKFINRENKKLLIISNMLFSLLIAFTINMLYSASFKMSIYESTYGYTYLRVFVHLFMMLLFLLCLVALAGIWYRKINIIKCILILSVAAYTIINYLNIDGFIAKKNVELYNSNGKVDVYYLTTLSSEAVPYLIDLQNTAKDDRVKLMIADNLKHRKAALEEQNSWTEFNFSRSNAKKLLR